MWQKHRQNSRKRVVYLEKNKRCENCQYYAEFEGVCCCVDSEEVANFTDENFVCKHHKMKEPGLFGEE